MTYKFTKIPAYLPGARAEPFHWGSNLKFESIFIPGKKVWILIPNSDSQCCQVLARNRSVRFQNSLWCRSSDCFLPVYEAMFLVAALYFCRGKNSGILFGQLCSATLLHTHREVDAHMAEQHDSSGVEYFAFYIQPARNNDQKVLSVLSGVEGSADGHITGFVADEFDCEA